MQWSEQIFSGWVATVFAASAVDHCHPFLFLVAILAAKKKNTRPYSSFEFYFFLFSLLHNNSWEQGWVMRFRQKEKNEKNVGVNCFAVVKKKWQRQKEDEKRENERKCRPYILLFSLTKRQMRKRRATKILLLNRVCFTQWLQTEKEMIKVLFVFSVTEANWNLESSIIAFFFLRPRPQPLIDCPKSRSLWFC